MAYVYTAHAGCVTIFSDGDKFRPVSKFTELHSLALATCSYLLLVGVQQKLQVARGNIIQISYGVHSAHLSGYLWLFSSLTQHTYGTECSLKRMNAT